MLPYIRHQRSGRYIPLPSNGGILIYAKELGGTSELQLAINLTRMGFVVSQPIIDTYPYDLICDWNGKLSRLQVKCTESLCEDRRYQVEAVNGANKNRYEEGLIDYFVVHVVPEEAWYVIPFGAVTGKKIIIYPHNPKSNAKYEFFRDKWYLLQ